ncbi:Uncharacterised protein [Moraxella caprae]|uniref:Lipoprotein n=1 Tax=Moraxella caprae TaxID=90240 RepID=A0A378R1R0_9GAMM|nr:hypothetical protein [Moraxella caprae]STZ08938.1 Uncharacterised protein [Moraxella caprae]
MKKLMLSVMAGAILLTGCATTGTDGTSNAINTATNVGMAVLKPLWTPNVAPSSMAIMPTKPSPC